MVTLGRGGAAVVVVLAATLLMAAGALAADLKELRVCADPDNLPFSNQQGEGFENRIAEVVARDLGLPLTYYWWPHQRGLVRNTLRPERCDVLVGIPRGYDPVTWTKAYYRSSYVLVAPRDRALAIGSLDDPRLRQLRIGVHRGTPPHDALGERGILDNVLSYPLFFDSRDPDPQARPLALLHDVRAGRLDVGIVWGPWAGYAAKKQPGPALDVMTLAEQGPIPMSFEVSMGVKKGQQELKALLEGVLDRRQVEIRQILDDYGVPQLAVRPPRAPTKPEGAPPAPPGPSPRP